MKYTPLDFIVVAASSVFVAGVIIYARAKYVFLGDRKYMEELTQKELF